MAESNLVIRAVLRNAVLKGWGATEPAAATAWVLRLPSAERANAMAAVFAGAAEHPESAVDLGRRLGLEAPGDAATYGDLLVRALDERGAFPEAAGFAQRGPTDDQGAWLSTVFSDWATYDPEQALAALTRMSADSRRDSAFAGIVTGWSNSDPAALAAYAVQLPPGDARASALDQALTRWALNDAPAAVAWINQQSSAADLDAGLSTVATQPDLVATRPDLAIECAVGIVQPDLRQSLLRLLAQSWAEHDRMGALEFIAARPGFTAADRRILTDGASSAGAVE